MKIEKLNVISKRYTYFIISGVLIFVSLFLLLWTKLNLWIDMTGWTQGEYSYTNLNISEARIEIDKISEDIKYESKEIINSTSLYKISWENKINVVVWYDNSIETKALEELKNKFRNKVLKTLVKIDNSIVETQYINIWKSFWDYIKDTAILTLWIAIVFIALYISWAFSWIASWISTYSFSWITIITLFHDVIISTWLYILFSIFFPEFKIDTFFITALLTILGYSINDTIVVFDRIRSNLEKHVKNKLSLEKIVDMSVLQTLKRSLYTSLTLLFVLITILFFGPESISWFTLVMIFWTIVWTYSSIFIASPLLYEMNKNKKLWIYKKKEINIEDKIVV